MTNETIHEWRMLQAKKLSSAPALPPGFSTGSAGGLPTGLDVVPTSEAEPKSDNFQAMKLV